MNDNFDIRKFLTENQLTTTSRSQKEKSAIVKKTRAGKDIGKKGKGFSKVAKAAGGGEKGTKIAASTMWKSLKEELENTGFRFNTQPRKVTGAAPDEDKKVKLPPAPDSYILGPTQLGILKKWMPSGPSVVSPGAKIMNGTLYILVSMIPELEGKRGRGGKYSLRDDIKASYGKISAKTYPDGTTRGEHPSSEGMEVLKALNYAILNSSEKSVQLPGKKGSRTARTNQPDLKPAMLDYKAIPGRVMDDGYEIPAPPKKDKPEKELEETNNLNENKTMVDNFDLKAFISSKRMFTENFEPMEIDEDTNSDIIPYNKVIELAKKAADVVPDAKFALIELAINRGKEEGIPRKDIEDVLEEYDMSIDYLENPDEENNIEYTHDESDENDEPESLDEAEDEFDDEEIDDSIWYKGDEEDEDIEFGAELGDYELPGGFEWEDDNGSLYEAEDKENDGEDYEKLERQGKYGVNPETGKGKELYEDEYKSPFPEDKEFDSDQEPPVWDDEVEDDEEIDDSKWYNDDDDEEIDFGAELGDYELPDELGWEDN